ncbi:MAG: tRNA uridine(34) 5-carboxymethylaminomethyl modification radical SAM/GNAT enzyme Elp3 [Patescibacteria group bacterium]|nr:tRNA uridine(34) 5-carboxymethylaminomethyl modification radical SAM/GNAT enzyme Elp3 [Patescibacteria group bacterium]
MAIKQKQNRKNAIGELLNSKIKSRVELMAIKRKLAKKYGEKILSHSEILKEYRNKLSTTTIKRQAELEKVLRKRSVRTMSGIAPVAVLTKTYPCPGKCAYCPTEKDVPQSYLSNEPAVMRAIRCGYDPYKQVQLRLRALEANGHEPTKIELIVIGGTWSVLPENYKYWYIMECFRAANEHGVKSQKHSSKLKIAKLKNNLNLEQKKNESAKYKIIGITLETRPDYINKKELLEMRELGCTRVELGVQAIDDKILKLNKRGHGVAEVAQATKLLKNYGFKVTYHIMPGLPGATAKKDLAMFKKLFTNERFQPDQLKFYPTVVTRGSLLYKWWRAGKYKPYSDKVLKDLIMKCKKVVPPYVRIIRLIRDIPGESIMAGNLITNLRQVMKDQGVVCRCIRCREAKEQKFKVESLKLKVIRYKASGGVEYFLSYESKDGKVLYGFCRLRLVNAKSPLPPLLKGAGLIRELHVYGELVSVGKLKKVQHAGLGKMLMQEAEKITREQGYKKIAVIAGVGVRGYYRKLGYRLEDSYMVNSW